MSIVGVQKGYGKIRLLDMLGHRIFPHHFWVGKVLQLAIVQSMHSKVFCGTNGLNKVYTVFRPNVFAIMRYSLSGFFCLFLLIIAEFLSYQCPLSWRWLGMRVSGTSVGFVVYEMDGMVRGKCR
jgi:hypothetical protein